MQIPRRETSELNFIMSININKFTYDPYHYNRLWMWMIIIYYNTSYQKVHYWKQSRRFEFWNTN